MAASTDPPMKSTGFSLHCLEYSEFKEALQQYRKTDDSIIYKLNTSIPTTSFSDQISSRDKCKELYDELQSLYQGRQTSIQKCINEVTSKVQELREIRNKDPSNETVAKQLRKMQTNLRLIQNELTVEEVIRERSIKVFKERCWQSYKPPDL